MREQEVGRGERWLPVVEYEGCYEVSDQGRVRSLGRMVRNSRGGGMRRISSRILAQAYDGHKRSQVCLSKDGKAKVRLVHQLVLEAFCGPRPLGMECCHWNDDPSDNRLDNLRWDTHSANNLDAVRNGRNHHANKTHCKRGHEFTEANIYMRPRGRECRECARIRWLTGGYFA